jgi:hypothetical protein
VQKPDGTWDFDRVLAEADFECIHCHKLMGVERNKRWMNDRSRRRWRRTNLSAEPYHISFTVSDFLSYLVTIGELAVKYIKTKGDPVARQGYRNHHEGKPYELRETKTEARRHPSPPWRLPRGVMPWLPRALILGSDVGLSNCKWVAIAIRQTAEFEAEAAVIDYGKELSPDDVRRVFEERKYKCAEDGKEYGFTVGGMDEKYRKLDVQAACFKSPGWSLKPTAGIAAELSIRSISFNQHPSAPKGFGIISYVDRDAKHDLYTARIGSWVIGTAPAVRPWPISSPKSAPSAARSISSRSSATIRNPARRVPERMDKRTPRRSPRRPQRQAIRLETQRPKPLGRRRQSRPRHLALLRRPIIMLVIVLLIELTPRFLS